MTEKVTDYLDVVSNI